MTLAMGWSLSVALPALLALLLVSAGIEDARTRNIANWKNATVALLAPAWWWVSGYTPWPDVALQVLLAGIVFAGFVGAFALGQMGGGDVKLIGALALWLPLHPLLQMLIAMSVGGGLLTLVMLAERWWRGGGEVEVPYGVAIVIAALLFLPRTVS